MKIFSYEINIELLVAVTIFLFALLIYSSTVPKTNEPKLMITYEAQKDFFTYMNRHPKAKEQEARFSNINDITQNIYDYFQIELTENVHKLSNQMILKNNKVITRPMMKKWIEENYHEHYVQK